jgi:serine phosphatase RsbU (regulator of sigma subunit)
MTKKLKLICGVLFFALMSANVGANFYHSWAERTAYSQRGWEAKEVNGKPTIYTVDADGPAAVLRVGDEVVTLKVEPRDACPFLYRRECTVPPGTGYKLIIRRAGQEQEFDLVTAADPLSNLFRDFAFNLVSLIFVGVGLAVFLLKPDDKTALLLALMLGSFVGLFVGSTALLAKWAQVIAQLARLCGFAAFFPLFLHFFLLFPERGPLQRRFPRLEFWLYLPFLLLILPVIALQLLGGGELLNQIPRIELIGKLTNATVIGYLVAGLAALIVNYRAADANNRRRTRVVVAGCGVGILSLLLVLGGGMLGLNRVYPRVFDLLGYCIPATLPLIPLSFAYAIIRHQVIPVSLIVRRSLRYLLVKRGSILLVMAGVGVALYFALDAFFDFLNPSSGRALGIISAVLAITVWQLARAFHLRVVAPRVDRWFFHQAYDAQQIIADLAELLRTTTSLPKLLELVATRIQSALHSANVAILLRDEASGDYLSAYSCIYSFHNRSAMPSPSDDRLPRDSAAIARLAETGQPIDLDGRDPQFDWQAKNGGSSALSSEEREALQKLDSALLLPIAGKEGLLGVISLGAHLGDLPFSGEDKKLLLSVSGPASFALENTRLIERMIEAARRRQELEAENEQHAKELEEARQLQLSMLPKSIPQLPHLEIAAYMKTATEVGGDYYDFHLAEDSTLTVAVGDATGHGLKAGTVVTAAKSLFNHLASQPDITEIFRQSSRALKRMNLRSLFMAMTMIKVNGNRLKLCAAGMPPVLIYRARTRAIEEVRLHGVPLGSLSNYSYRQIELGLSNGDVVLLMSDGFAERFNPAGEMLDYPRAIKTLAEAASRSPQEIIEHFVSVGEAWANGRQQDDDSTFVVLKVRDAHPELKRGG